MTAPDGGLLDLVQGRGDWEMCPASQPHFDVPNITAMQYMKGQCTNHHTAL